MLAKGDEGRYVVYTGLSKWCPSENIYYYIQVGFNEQNTLGHILMGSALR